MPSRYTFVDHDPSWPEAFRREAEVWEELLAGLLVTIHHIGSTSVPGLAAKPVIDLLPLVTSTGEVDERTSMIERAGYRAWGEYGLPGRRYFSRDDAAGWRTHNVHVYANGDPEAERHIAFPAYLRHHPTVAADYAAVKRRAYALHPDDVAAYNDAKNDWIKLHERQALDWWRRHAPDGAAS